MRSKKKCFRAAGEGGGWSAVVVGGGVCPIDCKSLCRKHFLFDSYRDEPDTWKRGNGSKRNAQTRLVMSPTLMCDRGRLGTGHRSDAPRDALSLSVTGVTILLSQTVFSLLVAHVITQTSDAVPLIG